MPLFGPKVPCPHCGKKVKRPRDPNAFLCPHCHQPGPWASPDQARSWEEDQARQRQAEEARRQARLRYAELLNTLSQDPSNAMAVRDLDQTGSATGLPEAELVHLKEEAWHQAASAAIADDLITPQEAGRIAGLISSLGLGWEQLRAHYGLFLEELTIAEANGGVLPTVRAPRLMTKTGEIVHLETDAALLKEVTLREFRAGYRGFSFPIGKTGIRYRVGGARGHSVAVGTEMKVEDSGVVAVSSLRAVFIGQRKTMEMPYSKLVNLTVFTDGVQFHVSNRQTAPLFRVANGEIVAAIINGAVHRFSSLQNKPS